MGLDLWFREDVARILASTGEAIYASTRAASAAHGPHPGDLMAAYQQGVEDALRAVGLAFGLAVEGRSQEHRLPGAGQVVDGDWITTPPASHNLRGWR
jgi:hypothetical protein